MNIAFPKRSLRTCARTKTHYVRSMHVAIAQRSARQVQSPRHSKQTNFHELRFHEACFRETAVLSFNCNGTEKLQRQRRDASLHCLSGNETERNAGTRSVRKSSTVTQWSLFREMQTVRGFAKHRKRGSARPQRITDRPSMMKFLRESGVIWIRNPSLWDSMENSLTPQLAKYRKCTEHISEG